MMKIKFTTRLKWAWQCLFGHPTTLSICGGEAKTVVVFEEVL